MLDDMTQNAKNSGLVPFEKSDYNSLCTSFVAHLAKSIIWQMT
jgi:hypothetical protein